ncbi:MAG: hypothetical protein RL379_732 [Bacillota bacterium]|jgi:hypothetical protein
MINLILTGFFNSGIVTIILLLIIFSAVALIASWLRKLIWPSTTEDLKIDPKKAVKEELDRVLVPIEQPITMESSKVVTKDAKPTKKTSSGKKHATNRKKTSS